MCSVDTWLYDKLVRICGFSTITYYEILWIHIGVELFTRPFLPLPSLTSFIQEGSRNKLILMSLYTVHDHLQYTDVPCI